MNIKSSDKEVVALDVQEVKLKKPVKVVEPNVSVQAEKRKIICYRCGGPGHIATSFTCGARNMMCRLCGKRGHLAKMCRTKTHPAQQSGVKMIENLGEVQEDIMLSIDDCEFLEEMSNHNRNVLDGKHSMLRNESTERLKNHIVISL